MSGTCLISFDRDRYSISARVVPRVVLVHAYADRIVVRRTRGPRDFVDDVNAWSGSMLGPAHTLAQSALFRTGNVSTRVDSLFYAGGSVRPGIGLPMCLISAEVLLKNLRGDTSTEPLPEPAAG